MIKSKTLFLISTIALVFGFNSAQAQVETNFSSGGGVIVGDSTSACPGAPSIEGAIRYDADGADTLDYCTGSGWVTMLTSSIGDAIVNNGNSFGVPMVIGTNDAQALAFETGGTTQVTIDTSGNVGIGTTAPGNGWNFAGDPGLHLYGADPAYMIQDSAGERWRMEGLTGGFAIANDTDTTQYFVINNDGDIGIGTNAPTSVLDINGAESMRGMSAPAVSAAGQGRIYFDSTSNTYKVSENNGAYTDLVGGGDNLGNHSATANIDMNGNTIRHLSLGVEATPAITFNSDLNTGLWSPLGDTIALSTGATERLRVTSSGNVGVGTTAPADFFHVNKGAGGNAGRFTATDNTTLLIETPSTSTQGPSLRLANAEAGAKTYQIYSTGSVNGPGVGALEFRNITDARTDMIIDDTGYIGIGSLSPEVQLDVHTGSINAAEICDENNANCLDLSAGVGGASAINDLSDATYDGTAQSLYVGNSAGAGAASTYQQNVALGYQALDNMNNASADKNTAIGWRALTDLTSGQLNTSVGAESMTALSTGNANTGVGREAMMRLTTGSANTSIGATALFEITSESDNTAVGAGAGVFLNGNRNVMVGNGALGSGGAYIDDADENTAIGRDSLNAVQNGDRNSGLGERSLANLTSGSDNIGIGQDVGLSLTTGSSNILIGNSIDASAAGVNNELNIGNALLGDLANGDIEIDNELRLSDADDSNHVGFVSPAIVGTDIVWTLPAVDGASGEVLSTNGSGVLSWTSGGGSGDFLADGSVPMTGNIEALDTGGIVWDNGGPSSWIYGNAAGVDYLAFGTDGVERMRILENGDVGIGTNNASHRLHLQTTGATYADMMLEATGTGRSNLFLDSGNAPRFMLRDNSAGADEKGFRITAESGEFHIATENDARNNAIPAFSIYRSGQNPTEVHFPSVNTWNYNDESTQAWLASYSATGTPQYSFLRGRGTRASPAAIQNGDSLGLLRFRGYYDNSNNSSGAYLQGTADGAPSGANIPTRLGFYTNDGTAMAERLTIKNNGRVGIGTTSPTVELDVNTGSINAAEICDEDNLNCFDISTGLGGASSIDDLSDADTGKSPGGLFIGHDGGAVGAGNSGNTGVGVGALDALTDATGGDGNTAVGNNALTNTTSGLYNTAVGTNALQANVSADDNTAIGRIALYVSTAANQTAVGSYAARYTTTGGGNTAIGRYSLLHNTTGAGNVVVGANAGSGSTPYANRGNMDGNTFVGYFAGANIEDGSDYNLGLGYNTGSTITTGDYNILIGYDIEPPTGTTSNYINIANTIIGDSSTGDIEIDNELRLSDADDSNHVGFVSPAIVGTDIVWTLPAVDGASGEVLSTNGSGVLSWVAAGGGGGDFLADGTVAMTGQFDAADGSAAAPSISFASDEDTGFYWTNSGEISITGNGSSMGGFDSSKGLVLFRDIQSEQTLGGDIYSSKIGMPTGSGEKLGTLGFRGHNGGSAYSGAQILAESSQAWTAGSAHGSEMTFSTTADGTNTLSERMRIDSAGNVGVGITNPTASLHVVDALNLDRAASTPTISMRRANNTLASKTPPLIGEELFRLDGEGWNGSGAWYNGGKITMVASETYSATAGGTEIRFFTTPDTTIAQAEVMRLDASGNVGIGTTAPAVELDVNTGTINAASICDENNANCKDISTGWAGGGGGDSIADADSNTQIQVEESANEDFIRFDTAGVERMIIDNNGDVAIGKTNPQWTLDVEGDGAFASNSSVAVLSVTNNISDNTRKSVGKFRRVHSNSLTPNSSMIGDLVFELEGFTNSQFPKSNFIAWGWENNQTNDTTDRDSYFAFETMQDNVIGERMRIDSAGNVGIGTATPGKLLHVQGTSEFEGTMYMRSGAPTIRFYDNSWADSADHFRLRGGANGESFDLQWNDASVPSTDSLFTVLSSGNVGIGTTNPGGKLDIEVDGASDDAIYDFDDTRFKIHRYSDTTSPVNIRFLKARGSIGSRTSVQNGDGVGRLQFRGYDGSNEIEAATIKTEIDGTPGTNDMPGRLVFSTTADGASSTTERMRIDRRGYVGIGTNNPGFHLTIDGSRPTNPVAEFENLSTGTDADGIVIEIGPNSNPGTNNQYIQFRDGNGTEIGKVHGDGSGGVTYATTSDRRIKTDIENTKWGLDDLLKVRVADYRHVDGTKRVTGFIAQELFEVYPQVVTPARYEDELWTVDYMKMTPLLTKSVQQLHGICQATNEDLQKIKHLSLQNKRDIASLKEKDSEQDQIIEALQKENAELRNQLNEIREMLKNKN